MSFCADCKAEEESDQGICIRNFTESYRIFQNFYRFPDCSLSQALASRGVPHSALRATTSGTNVVNLETDPTNAAVHGVLIHIGLQAAAEQPSSTALPSMMLVFGNAADSMTASSALTSKLILKVRSLLTTASKLQLFCCSSEWEIGVPGTRPAQ